MPQTTLRPVTPRTETIANISISGSNVYISFVEHDEKFRALIKDHGFSWGDFNVGWKRECNHYTGTALDRATEISILLLKAGFIVSFDNDVLKDKILKKEFTPEHKRWIAKRVGGEYIGWFSLSWEYGDEGLYKAARAIAGSKWSNPSVVVPPYQFEAVLDLVDMYGFKLSEGAKELIEQARQTKEEALIVDMSETTESPIEEKPKQEEYGICAALRDND